MLNAKKFLFEGSPLKALVIYSLPFILATLLQAVYNITDIIFMGHFVSENAASAVGIGGQLIYLVVNAVIGLMAGATILIAKQYGKNDINSINNSISALILILTVLCVILTVSMMFLSKPLLNLLKTPSNVLKEADLYVKLSMAGLIFTFIYNGIISIIRGVGDSFFPLLIILVAAVLNVCLDFLFIALLHMGVLGAGIATIISQGICGILAILITIKKKKLKPLEKFKFHIDINVIKEFLKLGIPIALLNLTATLSFMLLTFIVNNVFKDNAVAASSLHATASRFNGFAVLPSRAMASAIAVIVSLNLSKNAEKRNKPTLFYGIIICLIYGIIIALVMFFASEFVLRILGASPEAITLGSPYLKAMSFDYIVLPIAVCAYGLVEGHGKTFITMIINVIASLVIRVPLGYLLSKTFNLGMLGIGLSIPLASLTCLIMIWTYIFIKKMNKKKAVG